MDGTAVTVDGSRTAAELTKGYSDRAVQEAMRKLGETMARTEQLLRELGGKPFSR